MVSSRMVHFVQSLNLRHEGVRVRNPGLSDAPHCRIVHQSRCPGVPLHHVRVALVDGDLDDREVIVGCGFGQSLPLELLEDAHGLIESQLLA